MKFELQFEYRPNLSIFTKYKIHEIPSLAITEFKSVIVQSF